MSETNEVEYERLARSLNDLTEDRRVWCLDMLTRLHSRYPAKKFCVLSGFLLEKFGIVIPPNRLRSNLRSYVSSKKLDQMEYLCTSNVVSREIIHKI